MSADQTMVEKVARAMMKVCARPPGGLSDDREFPIISMDPDFDDLPRDHTEGTSDDDVTQEAVLRLARAAISAMREPTDYILDAAADAACDGAANSVNSRILRAIKAGRPREVGLAPAEWLLPAWKAILDAAVAEEA